MNNMRYIVFVDFDGVLTSNRVHFTQPRDSYDMWCQFDPIAIDFFNKIHNAVEDVYFVWTTTWRNNLTENLTLKHILYSQWYNAGFRGYFGNPWRVNPEDQKDGYLNHAARANEIQHYLENYAPDCKDFIILDDNDYDFNKVLGKKRFVQTDHENGLLYKHMKNAWSLMGDWDRR